MKKIELTKVIKVITIEGKEYLKFIKNNNDVNDRKLSRRIEMGDILLWNGRKVECCKDIMIEYYDSIDDDCFEEGIIK